MDLFLKISFLSVKFFPGWEIWKKLYVLGRKVLLGNRPFRLSELAQPDDDEGIWYLEYLLFAIFRSLFPLPATVG